MVSDRQRWVEAIRKGGTVLIDGVFIDRIKDLPVATDVTADEEEEDSTGERPRKKKVRVPVAE